MAADPVAQGSQPQISKITINVNENTAGEQKNFPIPKTVSPSMQSVPMRPGSANSGNSKGSKESYHSAQPVVATKIKRKLMAKEARDFVPCEPPPEEIKTVTYTETRVETIFEGDPKPQLKENEKVVKVERRKVVYSKRSEEGLCDFDFCRCKTFMKCDYDLNDVIDSRSKWP